MPTGKVKWYDPDKGYGLIIGDDSQESISIREDALKPLELFTLHVGQPVEYILDDKRGKKRAIRITLLPKM